MKPRPLLCTPSTARHPAAISRVALAASADPWLVPRLWRGLRAVARSGRWVVPLLLSVPLVAALQTGHAREQPGPASGAASLTVASGPSDVFPEVAGYTRVGPVYRTTLANGLELMVQPDRRAPTAVHMLWLRVGSMDETDGTSGVAHVLEHMMFKGTATLQPGDYSRRIAALGGRENAFTSRDATAFHVQLPANHLEDLMRLEADRLANNRWSDEEFRLELEVVKEERRQRVDDQPRAMLFEALGAAAWMAHPYRRPIIGWAADLDALKPDDVRSFQRLWYRPNNAAVVVAGDVDPAQVLAWAQAHYGPIPAAALPERKPQTEPAQLGERRLSLKLPAEQAYVAMALHAPRLTDPDAADPNSRDALALVMLAAVLDGYEGARLGRALVQHPAGQRLADSAGAGYSGSGRGPAQFYLDGTPASGRDADVLAQALRAEVARVARDGVSEAELQRVKNQWRASQVYKRDALFAQARELGSNWVVGWPVDASDRLLASLRRVTPEQVQAVAQRYVASDQLTSAVLVPDAEALAQRRRAAASAGAVATPPTQRRH